MKVVFMFGNLYSFIGRPIPALRMHFTLKILQGHLDYRLSRQFLSVQPSISLILQWLAVFQGQHSTGCVITWGTGSGREIADWFLFFSILFLFSPFFLCSRVHQECKTSWLLFFIYPASMTSYINRCPFRYWFATLFHSFFHLYVTLLITKFLNH